MLDHLSDRELEEIFKKVSESREFEYNPDAWKLIKPRLEKKKRRRRFLIWFFGLSVLAALLFGLFYLSKSNLLHKRSSDIISNSTTNENGSQTLVKNNTADTSNQNSSLLSIDNKIRNNESINHKTDHSSNSQNRDNYQDQANNQSVNRTSKTELVTSSKNITRSNISPRDATSKSTINSLEKTDKLISDTPSNQNVVNTKDGHIDLNKAPDTNESNLIESITNNLSLSSLISLPIQPLLINPKIKVLTIDTISTPNNQIVKKPSIGIELYLGREWSTSNISYFRTGDTKVGLSLSIPLSDKLAITTGAGYKTDKYGAGQGAYNPPTGFWTDGIAPRYTSATCRILDIPIGINYHFSGITETGFFSSAAITSIFMLREYYYFSYEDISPNHVKNWSGTNENNHLFNDLYLSSGYQLKLHDKYLIKFAPYFQIPLKGIGHGKLKLYTLGAKISVSFQTYK